MVTELSLEQFRWLFVASSEENGLGGLRTSARLCWGIEKEICPVCKRGVAEGLFYTVGRTEGAGGIGGGEILDGIER